MFSSFAIIVEVVVFNHCIKNAPTPLSKVRALKNRCGGFGVGRGGLCHVPELPDWGPKHTHTHTHVHTQRDTHTHSKRELFSHTSTSQVVKYTV